MLELPEETSVFVEKDDDLDFVDNAGRKSLASLKHKALVEEPWSKPPALVPEDWPDEPLTKPGGYAP